MSGTASVPTQFQSAVTATGQQLDNNFSTIVAYLNDPTNRMNYGADGGSTNTLVINPTPALSTGYSAGVTIIFRAAFSNTGAVVANVSGLGNASVLDQQGRQLTVSAIIAGCMYQIAYNGTSAFNLLSPNYLANAVGAQPAFTSLLSGAGTYTVSAGAVRIHVRGVGGGGGGGGTGGAGSAGGSTKFGVLLAGGGGGGSTGLVHSGGLGSTATGAQININGALGGSGIVATGGAIGGCGAASVFGGAGSNGVADATVTVGISTAAPNSGSGGGGGADISNAGGGGGAGAYFEHTFIPPAATYTYTVGAGGAGTSNGATGAIYITTYFS